MRKKSVLTVLAILVLGLIGTSLSTIREQNEFITFDGGPMGTWKFSYGFPLSWYGYSQAVVLAPVPTPKTYWFSLESFLQDAAFWVAISFFVSFAAIKSVNVFHKARASKNQSVINI